MATSAQSDDISEMIMNQLRNMMNLIANQESLYRQQISATQNDFEARLASLHPLPVLTAADEELTDQPQVASDTTGVVDGISSTPPSVPILTSACLQLSERLPDPHLFS